MTRTEFIMDYLSPARNRGGHSGWWESVEREIAALETDLMQHATEAERLRAYAELSAALLREWLATEIDPEDDEYEPWMLSFTNRVIAALAKNPNPAGCPEAEIPSVQPTECPKGPANAGEPQQSAGVGTRSEFETNSSPTPRTDEFANALYHDSSRAAYEGSADRSPEDAYKLAIDFARALELELGLRHQSCTQPAPGGCTRDRWDPKCPEHGLESPIVKARIGALEALAAIEKRYLDSYEFTDGETFDETPDERERMMIEFAIAGLHGDEEFVAAWDAWRALCGPDRIVHQVCQWRPVTEKPQRGPVLAYNAERGNAWPFIVTEHPDWWGHVDPQGRKEYDAPKFTHWMPLPESPDSRHVACNKQQENSK